MRQEMEISDKDERFQTSDAESWDGFFRARDGANVPEEFMLDRGDELPQHRSELEEHLVPDWLRESTQRSRRSVRPGVDPICNSAPDPGVLDTSIAVSALFATVRRMRELGVRPLLRGPVRAQNLWEGMT